MLLVAVARFSSDGVAIRYILVLWMTSHFHTMGPMGEQARLCVVCRVTVPVGVAVGRAAHWFAGSAGRLARAALVVWRLDSAAAGDGVTHFAVTWFMLVVICTPG